MKTKVRGLYTTILFSLIACEEGFSSCFMRHQFQQSVFTRTALPYGMMTSFNQIRSFYTTSIWRKGSHPWENLPMKLTVRDVKYDTTFKILFGEEGSEGRTISFLNAVLNPEREDDKIKKIKFLEGSLESFVDRSIHFDIKTEAECETYSGSRFIIEMQKARIPGHMKRWVYYGARELAAVGERNFKDAQSELNKNSQKKLHKLHYDRLDPVKVITILDFDDYQTRKELFNSDDIVVNWDITERKSKKIASNILSWTYVILPRFLNNINNTKKQSFDNSLDAWLYFITRSDEEEINVTSELVANDLTIAEGFHRVAHLTKEERDNLHNSKMATMSRDAREDEIHQKGKAEGKAESAKKCGIWGLNYLK